MPARDDDQRHGIIPVTQQQPRPGVKQQADGPEVSLKDFAFAKPRQEPIWLVEAKDVAIPGAGKAAKEAAVWPRLYLAFDVEGDVLIEAFTPPARPWWRRPEQLVGKAQEDYLVSTKQGFQPATASPRLTLLTALEGLDSTKDGTKDGAQIIVRNIIFTRGDAKPRPALVLFREGLHMQSTGPAPRSENIGRSMLVLDAKTGAMLHNEAYGNPVQPRSPSPS